MSRSMLGLVLVVAGGCAAHRQLATEAAPLATGTIRDLTTNIGEEGRGLGGKTCTVYADWLRIAQDHGELWVPRERVNDLVLDTK